MLTVFGVFSADVVQRLWGLDDRKIVIDEFVGCLIALFALPLTIGFVAGGFLLFRFFDILKPFPISVIDKRFKTGFGVMADDIVSGVMANIILQAFCFFG